MAGIENIRSTVTRALANTVVDTLDRATDAVREGRGGEVVTQARQAIAQIETIERLFE